MRARVFIWYGHHLFARVLEPVLRREGMEVVGVETDPAAALPAILQARPDVVVTDRIVEREHPLGIAEIVRSSARVRVLVLDLIEDEMRIYDGIGGGAARLTSIIKAIEDAVPPRHMPISG